MPAQDSDPGTAAAPTALDLACLSCGYNLRGLSGDPVRCPECGYPNPVGDLYMPPELIARRVRRAETPMAMSIRALALAFVGMCWVAWVASEFGGDLAQFPGLVVCTGSPTALGVVVWYVCRLAFRAACGAQAR